DQPLTRTKHVTRGHGIPLRQLPYADPVLAGDVPQRVTAAHQMHSLAIPARGILCCGSTLVAAQGIAVDVLHGHGYDHAVTGTDHVPLDIVDLAQDGDGGLVALGDLPQGPALPDEVTGPGHAPFV